MGDRWDTVDHDENAARASQPSDLKHFHGWHGDMVRVRGTVANDIAQHFWLQWNDPAPLSTPYNYLFPLSPFPLTLPTIDSANPPGNLTAQLLRTLSCEGAANGLYSTFAPQGEYSFLDGFTKMVENAKEYIYLEDQFVFYEEITSVVAKALPNVEVSATHSHTHTLTHTPRCAGWPA